jgi:hypothetical protein
VKITTFEPYLLVKDAESTVEFFESLGFERRHLLEDVGDEGLTGIVMRNEGGFRVNIVQSDNLPRESLTGIRINVDDFDEAFNLLAARGFVKAPGTDVVDTGSAKAQLMMGANRLLIELIQHIKS